jgi:hypothetical protein
MFDSGAWVAVALTTITRGCCREVFAVIYPAGLVMLFILCSAASAPVLFAEIGQTERTIDATGRD